MAIFERRPQIENVDTAHRNLREIKSERLRLKLLHSFERPGPHALTRHFKTPGRSTNKPPGKILSANES
jgi:hypothetical protein